MYTLLIILIVFLFAVDISREKKKYIIGITLLMIVIGGFRNYVIGTDTSGYVESFLQAANWEIDWKHTFSKNEPLFYFFQYVLSSLKCSYTVYLIVIAVFYYSVIAIFIKRYSSDARLSFLLFIALGHFLFSMAGIRQTIAMGFQLLCFMSLLDRKYIKSIVYIVIACGFHVTSIVFTLVYLLYFIPISIPFILGIIGLVIMGLSSGGEYAVRAAIMLWAEKRVYEESDGGISVFLILCILSAFSLSMYWKDFKIFKKLNVSLKPIKTTKIEFSNLAVKMLLVSLVFQALGTKQADTFRVAYMFDIVAVALIPNAFNKLRIDVRKIGYWILIVLIILRWYVLTLPVSPDFYPYKFFWEY